ncbi:MAG TPA: AsmA family protein [Candidatus Limnocylindrales bacterium]|jgi:uncharacterized protein involved in outer membrane biogenesis|nr:AsmA family protein [Candidatus Limnocylindrales bacterium]
MADATMTSPAPQKRRGWLRAIVWILGIFLVLIILAYFVGTSSAFFKGFILPKVGATLNARITVSDASIHPFSGVTLSNLKVETTGTEPVVNCPEVRVRYSLMEIIKGNIHVEELTLNAPTVTVVQNADGTSNLDPILKAMQQKPEKPKTEQKPSKPAQIDVRKITLTDGTLRQTKFYDGNHRQTAELSKLNVTLTDLKNGQTGKLSVSSDIVFDNNPPAPATNGVLNAKLTGNFSLGLGPDLSPGSIQGNTRLEVIRAGGVLAQLATLMANLDCDVTPTEVRQVALRFQKGNTALGQIRVAGPFDMGKTEGKLNIEVFNIDKNLLNLAGASSGLDFGPTTINSTNQIQLAKGGAAITATGQFGLSQLQLTRTNQATPPLDLKANYDVSVDRAANITSLRVLNVNGTQKGKTIFSAELTSPMTISSSGANGGPLSVAVTHLDLADWKPFLGDAASTGDVNMKLQLVSQEGGTNLTFDLNSKIDNLTAGVGSNQLSQATVTLVLRGKATELRQFTFPEYKFELARAGQSLIIASGSGSYNQTTSSAEVQLGAQVFLARLLQAFPQPDANVSSGRADLKIQLVQKPDPNAKDKSTPAAVQDVSGNFTLAELTGTIGKNNFSNFGATADLNVGMTPQTVQIRKISGKITEGSNPGGSFELAGTYGVTNKLTQLTAKLADLNQNGLRPFLEPTLGEKKLVSVVLNANASVHYDPAAASEVKADMAITNLVVNDPKGEFPATPLETKLQVDASLNKQIAEIRQFQIGFTPTARATNQVQLTGRIDMSQTNATQGNLKLSADSLDLTSYYDLFATQKGSIAKTNTPATTSTNKVPATVASANPERELPAQQLPLRNFVAEANLRRMYLHEVEIGDFQATTKIDGGHVVVNPFKLNLNGAPVNTTVDLDMGVPGYKYGLSFNAQGIPLAPLVNTFQPERKGQLSGALFAQAQINGIGTAGTNLQKNLTGQFDVNTTNLNLLAVNIRWPLLRVLINVVATIPDLLSNREGAVGNLLGAFVPGSKGGLSGDLEKSPIDKIAARGNMGSGRIELQQAMVQSSAFEADATGTITLASILTNSAVQIPVSVSLGRSVAEKVNMVPANAPTNAAYVKLPDFLTMRGTVGNPKADINKVALLGSVVRGLGGVIPSNSKSGNLIQGLSGILGGGTSTNTNAAPKQASTNQSPVGNLLNQFLKPKK